MAEELTPFGPADYLDDAESQTELLQDALASGRAGYIADALGIVARARGMTALAKETGLNRQALYGALCPGGNPTLDTLLKVMDALGLELNARPKAA